MGVKKCCEAWCGKGLWGVGSLLVRCWFVIGCIEVVWCCG